MADSLERAAYCEACHQPLPLLDQGAAADFVCSWHCVCMQPRPSPLAMGRSKDIGGSWSSTVTAHHLGFASTHALAECSERLCCL